MINTKDITYTLMRARSDDRRRCFTVHKFIFFYRKKKNNNNIASKHTLPHYPYIIIQDVRDSWKRSLARITFINGRQIILSSSFVCVFVKFMGKPGKKN